MLTVAAALTCTLKVEASHGILQPGQQHCSRPDCYGKIPRRARRISPFLCLSQTEAPALQQNCLCGKVLIWIKGGECVGNIDSRSPSSPPSRAVVEITCVITVAPPFPGDKGVNGCLLCKESAAVPLC